MPKRILQGRVVSDKTDKTIVVEVERRVSHPVFKKFVKKSKRFMAHDAENAAKVGDLVRIQECRPMSKRKRWELVSDGADAAQAAEG
ncbi:MAG: 30S ribosomal protein S17 [Marivibrio sp.]|uniref:30S ribosomal protein S17 n=1 Tax=Marivibrio sp. TaxID=2039719 RepID=UPI0032EFBF84